MDQEKIIDAVQEEVLKRLPVEAVHKLAELPDDSDNNAEIERILKENNVDAEEVAREIIGKWGQNV